MKPLAVCALAFALLGGASVHAASSPGSLYGTVMRGPITPVCKVGEPCTAPAAGVVLVFSRGRNPVAHVTVASNGNYRLRLPGGLYTVRAGTMRLAPTTARVYSSRAIHLDFSIDTGIR